MVFKKVLMIQMDVQFGEIDENLSYILSEINKIHPKDTLIILPELFPTGYDRNACESFEFFNHPDYEKIQQNLFDNQNYLYGSIPFREGGMLYNMAILIGPDGLLTSYKKSHLFGPMGEKDIFQPGRDIVNYNLNKYNIGLSICYDLRFPELYRELSKRGANLLLVCAEWPIGRISHWELLLKARAVENQCIVIGLNRVGTDEVATFGGNSMIVNSFGEVIHRMDENSHSKLVSLDFDSFLEFKTLFDTNEDKWM